SPWLDAYLCKGTSVPYVIGIVLSVSVALFARWVGFDRHRAFYPTVLVVIASYYVLFAAMSESLHAVLLESAVMAVFVIAAVAGLLSRLRSRSCRQPGLAYQTSASRNSSVTKASSPKRLEVGARPQGDCGLSTPISQEASNQVSLALQGALSLAQYCP